MPSRPPARSPGILRGLAAPGAVAALFVAGCANPGPTGGGYSPTGDPLVDGQALMQRAPARDRVVWQYRLAATALRRGQWAEAKSFLDEALAAVQGIYGPNPEARKSRSQFRAESKKTFIGEPYERAMAYYYRGILYWMDGEADNARACFRSGQFNDSDAENKTYAGDYVLFDYLDGLVTAKLGGDGSDALARAERSARMARPAPYYTNWNTLFFVEMGSGPSKFAAGEFGEQLRFRPGSSAAGRARLTVGGQTLFAEAWDDLSYQATTRGGRAMDHVLANKAVFKQATDAAGTVAILGGAVMASQQGHGSAVDEVGAGLIVAGVLSKILASATTPAADTRMWDNLPNYLGFTATVLPPGDHTVTVEFLDGQGTAIAGITRNLSLHIREDARDTIVFVSDKNR